MMRTIINTIEIKFFFDKYVSKALKVAQVYLSLKNLLQQLTDLLLKLLNNQAFSLFLMPLGIWKKI